MAFGTSGAMAVDEAIVLIRDGIRRLNQRHGNHNGLSRDDHTGLGRRDLNDLWPRGVVTLRFPFS